MSVGADDLRRGLQNGEFEPFFQPLFTLRTGELAGFELLARWRHPEQGLLLPDRFISIAEEEGVIGSITGLLLAKAFAAARSMPAHLWLSVNISPSQLRGFILPLQIESLARIFNFPLSRLVIEITENALFDDLKHAHAITLELKSLGCRIALDDFGTGYSSLLHLQSLPFDEIKIDRSFVASMNDRLESRKIVSAVIGLGQSLGLTVIAEGVSGVEQAGLLRGLGCELGQGWLFGKAVPAEELPKVLAIPFRQIPQQPGSLLQEVFSSTRPSHRLAQLQALYDGSPVGLAFLDHNLRYITLNQQLADLHGNPIEAYFGRTVAEMVPDVYPQLEPYLRGCLAGETFSGLEVIRPANGHLHEAAFLVSYLPVLDEAREVIGVSVSVVDITERRQTEAALRESEEHYRHMVELNPQIPWVFDPEGNAISISPRWERLTGTTADQNRGQGFLESVHPDDRERVIRIMERCFPSGEPIDVQFRARTRDGAWLWMRSRGAPRRDAHGHIICWYGTAEDIDAQRKAEEALRQSEGRLRELAEAFSAELRRQAAILSPTH
ncbi:EAL domain-containing protein [Silvibacterium sp.]|uniref:sensor domain-containing phosphodiesterase n=1 Tax=Silvibacterium sp. TaxID=1964179 RepID=UPI0039E64DB2